MSKNNDDSGAGCFIMLGMLFLCMGLSSIWGFAGVAIGVGVFFIALGLYACLN